MDSPALSTRRGHLATWMMSGIDALVREGHTLQSQFQTASTQMNMNHGQQTTNQPVKLMMQGKVKAAM